MTHHSFGDVRLIRHGPSRGFLNRIDREGSCKQAVFMAFEVVP